MRRIKGSLDLKISEIEQLEQQMARKEAEFLSTIAKQSQDIARLEKEVTQLQTERAEARALQNSTSAMQMRMQSAEAAAAASKARAEKLVVLLAEADACRLERAEELGGLREQLGKTKRLYEEATTELKEKTAIVSSLEQERDSIVERERGLQAVLQQVTAHEQQLQCDKEKLEVKLAKEKINAEFALEKAEALVEEIKKTHELEKQVMEEQAARMAQDEQRNTTLLSTMQQELNALREEKIRLTAERDHLIGHQNIQQKIQVRHIIQKIYLKGKLEKE